MYKFQVNCQIWRHASFPCFKAVRTSPKLYSIAHKSMCATLLSAITKWWRIDVNFPHLVWTLLTYVITLKQYVHCTYQIVNNRAEIDVLVAELWELVEPWQNGPDDHHVWSGLKIYSVVAKATVGNFVRRLLVKKHNCMWIFLYYYTPLSLCMTITNTTLRFNAYWCRLSDFLKKYQPLEMFRRTPCWKKER